MPTRQWRILLDITGPCYKPNFLDEDDESILAMMGSCNLDPSIRFFGIEWDRVFGKCFSLSLNVKIFGQQIMNSKKDVFCTSVGSSIDLILVSYNSPWNIAPDNWTIVTSGNFPFNFWSSILGEYHAKWFLNSGSRCYFPRWGGTTREAIKITTTTYQKRTTEKLCAFRF